MKCRCVELFSLLFVTLNSPYDPTLVPTINLSCYCDEICSFLSSRLFLFVPFFYNAQIFRISFQHFFFVLLLWSSMCCISVLREPLSAFFSFSFRFACFFLFLLEILTWICMHKFFTQLIFRNSKHWTKKRGKRKRKEEFMSVSSIDNRQQQ